MEAEKQRLGFVENRDGIAGAIAFAMQCRSQYRKAVLTSRKRRFTKPSHASLPEYRRGFIESYLAFKRYIETHNEQDLITRHGQQRYDPLPFPARPWSVSTRAWVRAGCPAMGKNVTQKLIESHLVEGRMKPGEEIGLKIDQALSWTALIESRRNRSNDWYHAEPIGAGHGPFINHLWRTSS